MQASLFANVTETFLDIPPYSIGDLENLGLPIGNGDLG